MADHASTGSHLVHLIKTTVPPIHRGGLPVIAVTAGTTLAARTLLRGVGLRGAAATAGRVGSAATLVVAAFFREPARVPPPGDRLVVAPADGLVSLIGTAALPAELRLGAAPRPRVSIFLSIFDVHVQRAPIGGTVTQRVYRPGRFLSADLDKASQDNERNSLVIHGAAGEVVVTQIAGLVARRIVCDAHEGQPLRAGQTYGLIRFGSRVDTYLPPGTRVLVHRGQRAVGGETALADLSANGA